MIAVFDYGAGNLRSVENTLAELGCQYELVRDSAGLRRASRIIAAPRSAIITVGELVLPDVMDGITEALAGLSQPYTAK